MKKIHQIIMLCAMGIVLASCDGSSDKGHSSDFGDYKAAVNEGDFEAAHEILEKIHDAAVAEDFRADIADAYYDALDYVYKKEIQTILLNDGSDAEDKIVFLLSEIPEDGICPPRGIIDVYHDLRFNDYCRFVPSFNRLCDVALTLSLNRNNASFAQNVIDLYKENVKILDSVDKVNGQDVGDHHYALFTNESRNAALKKYNNAVESGRFGDNVHVYEIVEDSIDIEQHHGF